MIYDWEAVSVFYSSFGPPTTAAAWESMSAIKMTVDDEGKIDLANAYRDSARVRVDLRMPRVERTERFDRGEGNR